MKARFVVAAAAAVAVAAGGIFGADSLVQASPGERVQLADAAQMDAVKQRQQTMKDIGSNMKTLSEFMKDSKGTAAEAEAAAAKIGELAQTIPAAFEVEASQSEMDAVGENRAKPEIWLNWDAFVERAEVLEAKSAQLVSAFQGGDSAAIQAALGDMGKNGCGACHDDFRGPKPE